MRHVAWVVVKHAGGNHGDDLSMASLAVHVPVCLLHNGEHRYCKGQRIRDIAENNLK